MQKFDIDEYNKEQKDKDLKEGIIYGLAALSLELFLIVILILVKNKKKLVALSEKFKDIDIDNDKQPLFKGFFLV